MMLPRRLAALLCLTLTASGATASDAGYRWENVTVGGGGFAPNVLYSKAEAGLAYLRTDMGGAYRWDASKGTWIPLQDAMSQPGYYGIESIAADPVDPEVVHMAVGMYKRDEAAMLRSFDRGTTWEITPVPFRMGGNEEGRGLGERLAIDPRNTDILYFGSRHDGLFRSTDRGRTWERVESFPHRGLGVPEGRRSNGGVSFVVFGPPGENADQSATLFAGVADAPAAGVYRSDDAGGSWRLVRTLPGLLPVKAATVAGRLYVTFSDGIGPSGVMAGAVNRFDIDSGEWSDITPPSGGAVGGFMGVSASRQDPDIVAVATLNRWQPGDTVFRSTDGGENWTDLGADAVMNVSEYPFLYWGRERPEFGWWMSGLAINPFDSREIAYTTGATVYRTSDATAPETLWLPWVRGIEQTAVITLASLPEKVSLLSGFGDISGFVHTDFEHSPQVMFTHPVFANTNTIEFAGRAPNFVVRSGTPPHRGQEGDPTLAWSRDFGFSWQPLTVPPLRIPGAVEHRYDLTGDHALTVSADGSTFMFLAPVPVISRDRGQSWTPSVGLPVGLRPVPDRLDPERFYALDFDTSTIYVSRDGGARFEALESTGLPSGLGPDRPMNREQKWPLIAAPGVAGELWLVTSRGLFRSRDGGARFERLETVAPAGSEPNEDSGHSAACTLEVEQMDFGRSPVEGGPPLLFAIGVCEGLRAIWRSDDSGRHWRRINDSNHEYGRRFRTIAGDRLQAGRVFLATDGRGILAGTPSRVDTYTLENDSLRFEFTPQLGGRGLSFSVPGLANLLKIGPEVASRPEPLVSPDGENIGYLGHIAWVGPQRDWWRDQSLNTARRDAGAEWPPDPYTVLARHTLTSLTDSEASLHAPVSPVTGLQLVKRITLRDDGLEHEVTAVNRRDRPVSHDIWFNTRVDPGMRVYVPVSNAAGDVRIEPFGEEPASADPEKAGIGYFDFQRGGPILAKAFIQPAAGWLAAFGNGQLFVVEFEPQQRETIHPGQGQVELFIYFDPERPDEGLLELEVHAPYRTLQPGEAMTASVVWRAWPSEAQGTEAQMAELLARGYDRLENVKSHEIH